MVTLTESIITEFLLKYEERGKAVIKAALEVSQEYKEMNRWNLGHFDFRGLMRKLEELGIRYNPSRLLRIMERDYGIIETSYKSGTQRWFTFTDLEAVKKVLNSFEDDSNFLINDPERFVLELQVRAIGIDDLYKRIRELSSKGRLTLTDRDFLRKVVFSELPVIARVLRETYKYDGLFNEFKYKAAGLLRSLNKLISSPYNEGKVGGASTKELISLPPELGRSHQ